MRFAHIHRDSAIAPVLRLLFLLHSAAARVPALVQRRSCSRRFAAGPATAAKEMMSKFFCLVLVLLIMVDMGRGQSNRNKLPMKTKDSGNYDDDSGSTAKLYVSNMHKEDSKIQC